MTSAKPVAAADRLDDRPEPLSDLLPPPFVIPRYDGLSVANVPATIGEVLDAPVGTLPPLDDHLWRHLAGDRVDRVVLLILDAVGWERLRRALGEDASTAAWLTSVGATIAPVTAIFPSTTTATLTTLWTGVPPAQHGLLGYRLWMREFGTVADMIHLAPAAYGLGGSLKDAGLDTATFLPVPRVVDQLAASGVRSYVHMPRAIQGSGLSELHFRGATALTGFLGLGDCMVLARERLEATAGQRALVAVYWDTIDSLSHARGPDQAHWEAEWQVILHAVRTHLVGPLSAAARRRTLLVITADHGHNTPAPDREIALSDHPGLWAELLVPPTGDRRAAYLHAVQGRRDGVRHYIETRLGHAFHVVDSDAALAAGLWGPGRPAGEARFRAGDLVLLARDGYTLSPVPSDPTRFTRGRHGSLWPDEALVPWIAWRLDG